jgi:hypothetical protein
MKAIGYMRVSTEEQTLTGVFRDAQEEKITASRSVSISNPLTVLRPRKNRLFAKYPISGRHRLLKTTLELWVIRKVSEIEKIKT